MTTTPPAPSISHRTRWLVLLVVQVAVIMVTLDVSVVNLALPQLVTAYDANIDRTEWLIVAYRLATAVAMLPAGRLADRIGKGRVFIGGLVIFTVASGIAGLTGDLGIAVAARLVQGAGSAGIVAIYLAILYIVFPPGQRGTALGIAATAPSLATALGTVVGGFIADTWGAPAVFLMNVPIGTVLLLGAPFLLRLKPLSGNPDAHGLSDWPAVVLSALAFSAILLGLDAGVGRIVLGDFAPLTVVAGVALLGVFVLWETRAPRPLVDLSLFRRGEYTRAILIVATVAGSVGAVSLLLPFYLQYGLREGAAQAGIDLLPQVLPLLVVGPIVGWVSDRIGTRWPVLAGVTITTAATFAMALLGVNTPYGFFVMLIVVSALGTAIYQPPNNVAALAAVPQDDLAQAGAIRNTVSQLAQTLATALAGGYLVTAMGNVEAIRTAPTSPEAQQAIAAFIAAQDHVFIAAGTISALAILLALGARNIKKQT